MLGRRNWIIFGIIAVIVGVVLAALDIQSVDDFLNSVESAIVSVFGAMSSFLSAIWTAIISAPGGFVGLVRDHWIISGIVVILLLRLWKWANIESYHKFFSFLFFARSREDTYEVEKRWIREWKFNPLYAAIVFGLPIATFYAGYRLIFGFPQTIWQWITGIVIFLILCVVNIQLIRRRKRIFTDVPPTDVAAQNFGFGYVFSSDAPIATFNALIPTVIIPGDRFDAEHLEFVVRLPYGTGVNRGWGYVKVIGAFEGEMLTRTRPLTTFGTVGLQSRMRPGESVQAAKERVLNNVIIPRISRALQELSDSILAVNPSLTLEQARQNPGLVAKALFDPERDPVTGLLPESQVAEYLEEALGFALTFLATGQVEDVAPGGMITMLDAQDLSRVNRDTRINMAQFNLDARIAELDASEQELSRQEGVATQRQATNREEGVAAIQGMKARFDYLKSVPTLTALIERVERLPDDELTNVMQQVSQILPRSHVALVGDNLQSVVRVFEKALGQQPVGAGTP